MFIAITLLVFILLLAWLASKIFTQRQLTWILWGCLISAVGAIAVATLLDEYRAYRKKLEPKPIITLSGEDAEFFVRLQKGFHETRSYYDIVKQLPPNSDVRIYKEYVEKINEISGKNSGLIVARLDDCQLSIQYASVWVRFFYDRTNHLSVSRRQMDAEETKRKQDRDEKRYLELYAKCIEIFKGFKIADQP